MSIEESFDTIFNMGYGGGGAQHPWSEKSPMPERVKKMNVYIDPIFKFEIDFKRGPILSHVLKVLWLPFYT